MNTSSQTSQRVTRLRKTGVAAAFAIGALALALPAKAERVDKISYKNDGDYIAQLQVQWMTPSGDVCGGAPSNKSSLAGQGKMVTIDLTGSFKINRILSDTPYCTDTGTAQGRLTIERGSTVWGVIVVGRNKYRTCRSITKNVTFSPSSGELIYKSEGTEASGNECQLY